MGEISNEEIIGFSEAYDYYNNLLTEEEKKKIPQSFVETMKKYAKEEYMNKIVDINDVNNKKISRDGLVKIAFMSLYYKY